MSFLGSFNINFNKKINNLYLLLVFTFIISLASVSSMALATHTSSASLEPEWSPAGQEVDYTVTICNDASSGHSIDEVRVYMNTSYTYSIPPCEEKNGWELNWISVKQACHYIAENSTYYIDPDECDSFDFSATTPASGCQWLWQFESRDVTFPNQGSINYLNDYTSVDDLAPEITKQIVGAQSGPCPSGSGEECWIRQDTQIKINVEEKGDCGISGLDWCEITYTVDGGSPIQEVYEDLNGEVVWNYTMSFDEDSVHVLTVTCKDIAGNENIPDVETFRVDDTPPETTKQFNGPQKIDGDVEWIDGVTTVTLSPTDPDPTGEGCNIGVDKTWYKNTLATGEDACRNPSTYCIADQIEYPTECINAGQEYCEIEMGFTPNTDDWYDCVELYAHEECDLSEGWKLYRGVPIEKDEESCHILNYFSVDELGNIENMNVNCFFVDKTPPVLTKVNGNPKVEYWDECGNGIGWSSGPVSCAQQGKEVDCCWGWQDTHVHDLGKVLDPGFVSMDYRPGTIDGCQDTATFYYSEDGSTWTEFYSEPVESEDIDPGPGQNWRTYHTNQYVPGSFRYIKIVIPTCMNDYSNAKYATYVTNETDITFTCIDQQPHPSEGEKLCFRVSYDYVEVEPRVYDWGYITDDYCEHYNGELIPPDENCEEDCFDWCCVHANSTTNNQFIFNFQEESMHNLEYYCKDAVEKGSPNHGGIEEMQYYKVDDTPPYITKTMIGDDHLGDCPPDPEPSDDVCYVKDDGENGVHIAVDDGIQDPAESGICKVNEVTCEYELWWYQPDEGNCEAVGGKWNDETYWCLVDSGEFGEEGTDVIFYEDSNHTLRVNCEDKLGNKMDEEVEEFLVDSNPPETTKEYGQPSKVDPECYDWCMQESTDPEWMEYCTHQYCDWWITSQTPVNLTAEDEKVGQNYPSTIYWRNLWFPGHDEICYHKDVEMPPGAGEVGIPPVIQACSPAYYQYLNITYNNSVPWNVYEGPFYKSPESCHVIEYYAVDALGNEEEIKWQCVFVDNMPPEAIKTVGEPKIPGEGGDSVTIHKEVTTGEIAVATPEIYFLADTTGSMGSVINQVKSNMVTILGSIEADFGAGDYKDFPYDLYAFQNKQSIIDNDALVINAINLMYADGGSDGSEGQLYALHRIAQNDVEFSGDATKIVVWFGDWPGHDPVCAAISGEGSDITEASVITELQNAGIIVIAISTTTGGIPNGMDYDPSANAYDYSGYCTIDGSSGQATRIAEATGGIHLKDVDASQITTAIINAIGEVTATTDVVPDASDCEAAGLDVTFDPLKYEDVGPLTTVEFDETLELAEETPPDTEIICDIYFRSGTLGGIIATESVYVNSDDEPTEPTPGSGTVEPEIVDIELGAGGGIDWWVRDDTFIEGTPITLECNDQEPHPVGQEWACFRVSFDEEPWLTEEYCTEAYNAGRTVIMPETDDDWCCVYVGEQSYTFSFHEDSVHDLEFYCKDHLENTGETDLEYFRVDSIPPVTTKQYLGPFYTDGTSDWIDNASTVELTATDPDPTTHGCNVSGVTTYYNYELVEDEMCLGSCILEDEEPVFCDGWACLDSLAKDFFTTGRYGDNLATGAWELAIWENTTGGEVVRAQDNYVWTSGQEVDFSLKYDAETGTVEYVVGDKVLQWTYDTGKAFDYIIPFAKGNVKGNSVELTELKINGVDLPDLLSGSAYKGLKVPLGDNEQMNGFELTGKAKLIWGSPVNEIPGFHVFAMNTHDNTWYEYEVPFGIPEESCHLIKFFSMDALGNTEPVNAQCVFVDHTPPVTTKTYGTPYFKDGKEGPEWITSETEVTLSATDQEPHPSGVAATYYKDVYLENKEDWHYCYEDCELWDPVEPTDPLNPESEGWTLYEAPLHKSPESCHIIEYYSVDNVDKVEEIKWQCVFVDNSAPEPNKTVGDPKTKWYGEDAYYYDIADKCWNESSEEYMECWKVTLLTPISLECTDLEQPHPVPIKEVCYNVGWDAEDVTQEYCGDKGEYIYDEEYEKYFCCVPETDFYFREETEHELEYYCVDILGNKGDKLDIEKFKVTGTTFNITLNKKWNLISVPFVMLDDSVEEAFSGIEDKIISVWTYDAFTDEWYVYIPNGPNTINEMKPGWGYWVLTNNETEMQIGGSLFAPGQTPPDKMIKHGWNLIGYYGNEDNNGNEIMEFPIDPNNPFGHGEYAYCVLFSLGENYYDKGWSALSSYWEPWNPDQWADFTYYNQLDPGAGYWLFATEDSIYAYTTNCGWY